MTRRPSKITDANRGEFEQLGVDQVRKRVENSTYAQPKLHEA